MGLLLNKTRLLLLIITTLMSAAVYAQPGSGRMPKARMERVHAMKIGFITERLQLSSSQAERFWPVYNKYEAELRETRMQFMKNKMAQRQNQDMTDEEARQQIEDNLEMQESMIELRKKYKNEFLKVISAKQLMDLYNAENDFRQTLMKEMRERKERRGKMRR